jgi:hypothetical protein
MRGRILAFTTLLVLHGCTCAGSSPAPEGQPSQQGCGGVELVRDGGGGGASCLSAVGGGCVAGSSCPSGTYHDGTYECAQGAELCCVPVRDATSGPPADSGQSGKGGICNGDPCGAGCTCMAADTASASACVCGDGGDASEEEADATSDAPSDVAPQGDASDDAELATDASDASTDAPPVSACGVITCLPPCVCIVPAESQCGCP